jgi:hypothetical protein
MYNPDPHQPAQLEINGNKPLNLKFGYPEHLMRELSSAINFVLAKLDFTPLKPIVLTNLIDEERLVIFTVEEKQINIYLHQNDNSEFQHIVVYTNDCLRDYHHYILLGVEFTSRPVYCSKGLRVDFYGEGNTLYTLLEERDYMNA